MNRLMEKSFAVLLTAVLTLAGCSSEKHKAEKTRGIIDPDAPRPNVIIYLIDALRWDHVGCYGYFRDTTPAIDRFARDSIIFTNAYAQSSWTKPSVGTLFTGRYASAHGAIEREDVLYPFPTLAESMKKNGYGTAAFVTNLNVFPEFGYGTGFEKFFRIDVEPKTPADRLNAVFFSYLKQKPEKPLFLYLHSMDPHYPYIPPPPYDIKYSDTRPFMDAAGKPRPASEDMNRYDGEVAFNDYHFGKFIERLKKAGMYENSLIIVMSDHGEEFMDHGGRYHGWTLFEELIHIPMIIKLPGGVRAGEREGRPVRILDIFPTVCDLLGIRHKNQLDGASIVPILAGGKTPDWKPALYAEERLDGHNLRSWISGGYKFIDRVSPENEMSLFNLKNDPGEKKNLLKEEPARVGMMKAEMDRLTAGLTWGYYLDISREKETDRPQTVRGYIKVSGAEFDERDYFETETGDSVVYSKDRTAIFFKFHLVDRPNPLKVPPPVLRDAERIRFTLTSNDAKLLVEFETGGQTLDAGRVALGAGGALGKGAAMPFEVPAGDPRLSVPPGALNFAPLGGGGVVCRLYSIPRIETRRVQLDEKQKRRLRDLGYIH